jgi:PilZ domain-containing protein
VCPANRRSERIHVNMPLTLRLQFASVHATFSASTIDLSELGARIRADAPLVPGQRIEVIPNESAGVPVPGRVVWVGRMGSAQAGQAGVEFLHSLSAPV